MLLTNKVNHKTTAQTGKKTHKKTIFRKQQPPKNNNNNNKQTSKRELSKTQCLCTCFDVNGGLHKPRFQHAILHSSSSIN